MLSNKKIVPHSGDPSSGYAAFRMTCWGDTSSAVSGLEHVISRGGLLDAYFDSSAVIHKHPP